MSINLKTPIVPADGRKFFHWSYDELYIEDSAESGMYVPNEGNLVEKLREKTTWIVSYRNPLPPYDFTLEPYIRPSGSNGDVVEGDRSPMSRDAFRVLINKDRVPATLNLNSQWFAKGSANSYIRVWLGTNVGEGGVCISGYMQNGRMVSDRIPLELAFAGNESVKTLKHPVPGICTQIPKDGEKVTVVTYNDVNDITDIGVCNVTLTDMAMIENRPQKRIVDIRMKSPHMSTGNANQLELPVNVPIDDILITCEVLYTTGAVEYNIDGNKVKLLGLKTSGAYDEMFISSMLGAEIPLQLSYVMSAEETYIGNDIVDNTINRRYTAITEAVEGAYSPKLFVVPTWAGANQGYRLEYYLADLRRNGIYHATPFVRYGENSPPIDPLLWGVTQRVSVRVNTAEVSPTFKQHYHTEKFAITFTAPGIEKRDNFILEYQKGSPAFGDKLYAVFEPFNVTFNKIDITCGIGSMQEWLRDVYLTCYPVYDRKAEGSAPPMPTHYELVVNNRAYRHPIEDWLTKHVVDTPVVDGNHVRINWVLETPTDDLYLGVSSLMLHENK